MITTQTSRIGKLRCFFLVILLFAFLSFPTLAVTWHDVSPYVFLNETDSQIIRMTNSIKFTNTNSTTNTLLIMPDFTGSGKYYPFAYQDGFVTNTGLAFDEAGAMVLDYFGNTVHTWGVTVHTWGVTGNYITAGTVTAGDFDSASGHLHVGGDAEASSFRTTSSDSNRFNGTTYMSTIAPLPRDTPVSEVELDGGIWFDDCVELWSSDIEGCSNNDFLSIGGDASGPTFTMQTIYTSSEHFLNKTLAKFTNTQLVGNTVITNGDYYSSDGSEGITNETGFWLCTSSSCASTCQAIIKDGLITNCTGSYATNITLVEEELEVIGDNLLYFVFGFFVLAFVVLSYYQKRMVLYLLSGVLCLGFAIFIWDFGLIFALPFIGLGLYQFIRIFVE